VNEINHIWHRESQGRSVEDVFDDLHAVRNQTLLRLEAFDDKDLFDKNRFPWMRGKSLGEIVSENTFEHEIEHLATIKVWKGPRP
jgi:hypothetical protein